MDEQYLQQLLEMIQAQYAMEGGGPTAGFGDPFAPSGGFPSPPMPNGKMPQYRTQGSGFVSDGTVKDMLGKVLVNQDQFSADAFFDVDPALKPIIARAVSEGGHDPMSVYSLMDDDAYRRALLDAAMRTEGLDPIQPDLEGVEDVNMDDRVDVQDLTYDQYKAQADASVAGREKVTDTARFNMYGDAYQNKQLYSDVLNERLSGYQGALDDFVTQAAPSHERNLNQLDFAWERTGGMPYNGMGGGALDYAGTGPGFAGGNRLAQAAGALPAGDDPAMGAFVEQYLRDHGVDFEANKRNRDWINKRTTKRPAAKGKSNDSQKRGGKNDTWYMKALSGDLSGIRLPRGAGIIG